MHRGYVKLFRKLDEWEWYDDLQLVGFFVHLLLSANFNENRYHGCLIPRGSLVFGRKASAKKFGIGEQVIRTMLTRLKSTSEITIKTTNKFSVICIVNFEKYQETLTNNKTAQLTDAQPTTNQQLTTLKEVKKLRSKEYIQTEASSEVTESLDAFNDILKEYPIKIGASKARLMFFNWNVTGDMIARIKASVEKYKAHLKANDWKTAMNFNTFLEGWTDWESHEEVLTEDQKVAQLRKSLKERV